MINAMECFLVPMVNKLVCAATELPLSASQGTSGAQAGLACGRDACAQPQTQRPPGWARETFSCRWP